MRLTFIGKDPLSNPTGSPTVYTTERETLVVQGWKITELEVREQMDIPVHEDAVEIPNRMLPFFLEAFMRVAMKQFVDGEGRDRELRDVDRATAVA